jgi:hypothetical protein
MFDINVKVKGQKIKFNAPDNPTFWRAVAVEAQKEIRTRTEKTGKDVDDRSFVAYSKAYEKRRAARGRSTRPNLSFTAKMLGSMRPIGRKGYAVIRLTGEQAEKAIGNEARGREFFGLSKGQTKTIFKEVLAWVTKHNKLR